VSRLPHASRSGHGDPAGPHVGFTGTTQATLPGTVIDQGKAVDVTVRPHYYGGVAAREKALCGHDVAVLVVDAHTLTWPGKPDERLRAIVTGAIQLVTVQQRAAAAGIDPALASGGNAGLVLWIAVQALVLQRYFILQPAIAGAGAAEMLLAWLWQRAQAPSRGSPASLARHPAS